MGLMNQFQDQPSSLYAILSAANGNPQSLMSQMLRSNSAFADFVEKNKNKTPEQAFREHGFDFSKFKHLF